MALRGALVSAPVLRPSDRGPARATAPGLYGAVEGDFGRVVALAQSHRLQPRAVLHVEDGPVSLSPEAAAVLIEALARFIADAGGA